MKALVTGCAGFIGSHLVESLLHDGESVIGIDCFTDNYPEREKLRNLERAQDWNGFSFIPADLRDCNLAPVVAECDAIFHLAAEPGVGPSWGTKFEQYLRSNVLATQRLLDVAGTSSERRFVYASSSSVYGQAERFPTPEALMPRPLSPYGVTKLAGEHLCALYNSNFGVPTVSLRLFSVYGPRQRPDMAFNIFCRAAVSGGLVTVFGDGRQTRDFTYVADVVRAFRIAATASGVEGETFNVGGGSSVSLNETLSIICDLGSNLEVRYERQQAGDARDTCADTTRAREVLGFQPTTQLGDGLAAEFAWVEDSVARDASMASRS